MKARHTSGQHFAW